MYEELSPSECKSLRTHRRFPERPVRRFLVATMGHGAIRTWRQVNTATPRDFDEHDLAEPGPKSRGG